MVGGPSKKDKNTTKFDDRKKGKGKVSLDCSTCSKPFANKEMLGTAKKNTGCGSDRTDKGEKNFIGDIGNKSFGGDRGNKSFGGGKERNDRGNKSFGGGNVRGGRSDRVGFGGVRGGSRGGRGGSSRGGRGGSRRGMNWEWTN